MADEKVQHLQLIQNVVSRMAGNCFLLKGWAVTLVSALFALSAKDTDKDAAKVYVLIAWLPVVSFAVLDVYYLFHERLFRDLYEQVAKGTAADYSLDVSRLKTWRKRIDALRSISIWAFYPILIVALSTMTYYVFSRP
jgi:uncharacterized membrane protein